jgi:branched-subunit amino acid aminotransferase/4-amino-4-deoxychorismate lyase
MTLLALAVTGRGAVDPEEPSVFADDEAFLRGRAAFETVRVYGGRPFRLGEHLDRLAASAGRLGLPPVAGVEELVGAALEAAAAPDAMLRIYWTPGREGAESPLAYVLVRELPPDLDEQRARGLALVSLRPGLEGTNLLGGVKSTSYALNMVATDEAKRRGGDDAVFVAADGTVLEAPTSNLWWRRGQELLTPSLDLGILKGVTRAVLLELAPGLGYAVREGAFPLADLAGADEAFTSSSVREVMPARSLDGAPIPLGPAASALQAALRDAAGA